MKTAPWRVLDLTDAPGERLLRLKRNGAVTEFVLPGRGRAVFPGWTVRRGGPNFCRPSFRNGAYRFSVGQPLESVRLALRKYGEPVRALLDGRAIDAAAPVPGLPEGFAGLYLGSGPLRLEAGTHLLELADGGIPTRICPPHGWLENFPGSRRTAWSRIAATAAASPASRGR